MTNNRLDNSVPLCQQHNGTDFFYGIRPYKNLSVFCKILLIHGAGVDASQKLMAHVACSDCGWTDIVLRQIKTRISYYGGGHTKSSQCFYIVNEMQIRSQN